MREPLAQSRNNAHAAALVRRSSNAHATPPPHSRTRSTNAQAGDEVELPKQRLEISAKHPVITGLNSLRLSDPALAEIAARQLLDNAVVGAGLVDDPRTLLPRLNVVLARLVGAEAAKK